MFEDSTEITEETAVLRNCEKGDNKQRRSQEFQRGGAASRTKTAFSGVQDRLFKAGADPGNIVTFAKPSKTRTAPIMPRPFSFLIE